MSTRNDQYMTSKASQDYQCFVFIDPPEGSEGRLTARFEVHQPPSVFDHPERVFMRSHPSAVKFFEPGEDSEAVCWSHLMAHKLKRGELTPEVEVYVRWHYTHYPDLFKRRLDVLDHALCNVGSGVKWCLGGLFQPDDSPEVTRQEVLGAYAQDLEIKVHTLLQDNFSGLSMEELQQSLSSPGGLKDSIEQVMISSQREYLSKLPLDENDQEERRFSTLSDYSNICNVPNDVRQDWLDTCRDILRTIILRDPSTQNVNKAKSVLDDLGKRFPPQHKKEP